MSDCVNSTACFPILKAYTEAAAISDKPLKATRDSTEIRSPGGGGGGQRCEDPGKETEKSGGKWGVSPHFLPKETGKGKKKKPTPKTHFFSLLTSKFQETLHLYRGQTCVRLTLPADVNG